MTILQNDTLIGVLRCAPAGMTTREVAERIGTDNIDLVGSKLSKLASYGKITRSLRRAAECRSPSGWPSRWYIWSMKEAGHA